MLEQEKASPTKGAEVVGRVLRLRGSGSWTAGDRLEVSIKGSPEAVARARGLLASANLEASEEDELTDPFESDWFKEAVSRLTPARMLKIRMENKEWQVKDLVEVSGIAQSAVSSMLAGTRAIGPTMAEKLAKALGCEVADLTPPTTSPPS